MRVSSGSSLVAVFGFLTGLAMAMHTGQAQEADADPPTEPTAIEIIGDAPDVQPEDADQRTPDRPGKIAEDPAGSVFAPADLPQAATASTSGSGGSGTGAGAATAQEKVDPFVGSFSTAVQIQTPPFHGIEPNLALTYNSSRGNGFVGVGWRLSGLSVIERASPGRGTPRHDATDIFLLDGQELVRCVTGTVSPSCDTGGTHASKVESYLRIKQDTTANTWEITGRDGTKTTYTAVMGPDTSVEVDTYRWAMASVVDTRGNTVTYSWWCDGSPAEECYPDTITYNGNTVQFHREPRLDVATRGTGTLLAQISFRLKSIDVTVGADRLRAYALSYADNPNTTHSLLTTSQQFGRDAAIDAGGAVTGPTSLPATALDYQTEDLAFDAETQWHTSFGHSHGWANTSQYPRMLADVNGDGLQDIVGFGANGTAVSLSTGTGFGSETQWHASFGHSHGWANTSRYPRMLADVNGDGLQDIVGFGANGTSVALSTGTGFGPETQWHASFGHSHGWANTSQQPRILADVNGDGLQDIVGFGNYSTSVALSTGSSFGPETQWHASFGRSHGWADMSLQPRILADVNGDGLQDIVGFGNYSTSVALSTGSSFGPETQWHAGFGRTDGWSNTSQYPRMLADVNGDGLQDVVGFGANGTSVALSTGSSFGPETQWHASFGHSNGWTSTITRPRTLADVNGDGLRDIVGFGTNGTFVALSTGSGFGPETQWHASFGHTSGWTSSDDRPRMLADVSGDGMPDIVGFGTNGTSVAPKLGDEPDLLSSVTNPFGGTASVAYAPSSAWTNQNLPMILQTVSAITTDDGRGNTATTSYAYEGGLWDAEERRFLGFRKATTTLPCIAGEAACPYSETTFRQDRASAGRVEQVDRFDGAGTLLTRALEEYVVNDTTVPYTALNTASESHIVVGAVTRRTRVTRDFDDYANVVEETAHGDADAAGDEITAATDYFPNTSDYIVSLPARVRSFDGIGTAGTLLTESRIIYDQVDPSLPSPPPGNTSWDQPPLRGDANETQDWLDTESRFISAHAEYDAQGNVTATVDPLGRRSEIDYDTTYNLYPVAARNPLYFAPANDTRHQTSTTWDTVCGVPTVATDLNGNDTTTQYDALCRPIRTDLPDGGFTITSYNNLGDPGLQYVETQTPPADGSGNIWSRTYMDGFGRPYRSTAKGPAAGQDITADTAYDDRGNVASQTAPYYTGDPVYTTTFDYDALDRPVATNHPDGNWTETDYGVEGVFVSTTSTDELGHPVTLHLDAFGRAVRKEEPLATTSGTVTVVTAYAYDDFGRLTFITDDVGNTWGYTHDSLGRTLTVDDPDLGVWTKTYDDTGQLETQTDALAQVTRFTYDALGRMLTKTARDGTAQAELTTYSYDEAVAGFHNMGLLTRAENPSGILRNRYDQMSREAQRIYTIDGSDYTLASGFDIAGRLIWQDYPDGDSVGSALDPITYNAAGRLDAVPGLVTSATYDASGRADVFTRANGVVSTFGYSLTRGWLDSLTTTSGATSIQSMTYGRDPAGQITSVTSTFTDESWTYGYDALRRLLTATNTDNAAHNRSYTYDSIGNMLTNSGVTGTYSYPTAGSARPHAVTSVGSWTYTYDANGNMTAGAGRTYTYNGENRPTQIDTQAYTYGPDGERWKTVDSAPGGGTTLYLGGSIEIAAGVMTKYLPGSAKRVGSPGDPLVETFWLHHDHQGSIQAITDAAGAQVQRFTYFPYGDRIATATAHEETKGWIGERQDATGLFYLHARYYDPVIGRFNSADPSDPMAPGVGLNRYAYALNNPVMRVDPWGLRSSDEIDHGDVHHRGSDRGGGTKFESSPHGGMTPGEYERFLKRPSTRARMAGRGYSYNEQAGRYIPSQQSAASRTSSKTPHAAPLVVGVWVVIQKVFVPALGLTIGITIGVGIDETLESQAIENATQSNSRAGAVATSRTRFDGQTLFHYTTESGLAGILDSMSIDASEGDGHAFYGPGQYFSDIPPELVIARRVDQLTSRNIDDGFISLGQLAYTLFTSPRGNNLQRSSFYVEVDVTGLTLQMGRDHVYLHPSTVELDISDRFVRSGATLP